jgi:hypothetical protein
MNVYQHVFYANCPDNDLPIRYSLTIQTHQMINVFEIAKPLNNIESAYQEDIADLLFAKFGGYQKIEAYHHGFSIVTIRSEQDTHTVLGWNPYSLDKL